jgi:hypothetical protein
MADAAQKLDFAAAARRLTATQIGLRERRRFRRMPITVDGRILDSRGREFDCRTADISPGDVRIVSSVSPTVGDRVVLYLEGFGRLSGRVTRHCGEGESAVIFDFSAHKREKLAEQITATINKHRLDGELDEATARIAERAKIELETGEIIDGEILDFSIAGITVRAKGIIPLIGSWARIGGVYGRVSRLIEGGFAIDFELRPAQP